MATVSTNVQFSFYTTVTATGGYKLSASASINIVSAVSSTAKYKWENEQDTSETWTTVSDTAEGWTVIPDTPETWH